MPHFPQTHVSFAKFRVVKHAVQSSRPAAARGGIAAMLFGLLCVASVSGVAAQDDLRAIDAIAAADDDVKGLRLTPIVSVSPIPPRADSWWPMSVTVTNSADAAKTARIVVGIAGQGQAEFSSTFVVRSNRAAVEVVWIKLPDAPPGTPINLTANCREVVDGREINIAGSDQRSVQDLRVLLTDQPIVTAIVSDIKPPLTQAWEWRKDSRYHTYNLAVACREADRLPRNMVDFEVLPTDVRAWDAIDNLFVFDDSGLVDPAGVAAMRQWLVDGGRAWIALDRVSIDSLKPLIGDLWRATDLGRMQFSEYDAMTKLRPDMSTSPRHVSRYLPADVQLISQDGGEVTHTINGWPAAVRLVVGGGEVWLTTVDASAWYQPTDLPMDVDYRPENVLTDWTIPLVSSFQQPRVGRTPSFVSTANAAIHVGYPVPSLTTVLGSMGFFLVGSIVCGAVLWRRGRLEWTGWGVPAIALLSALPLLASATSSRSQVKDTLAHVQFADVQPGSGQAVVQQRSVVYLSQPRPLSMDLPADMLVQPFVDSSSVTPYVYSQPQTGGSRVAIESFPTGLQPIQSTFTTPVEQAEAIGRFTPQGVDFTLPASLPGGSRDALFVMPPGRLTVLGGAGPNGQMPGGGDASTAAMRLPAVVPTDTEIRLGTGILDQTLRHHQDVYRDLFADPSKPFLNEPGILVWSQPWRTPLDSLSGVEVKGEALSRLRIRYLPVAAGQTVALPAGVLEVTSVEAGAGDTLTAAIAAGLSHSPMETPKTFRLRWRLPAQVTPLKLESAKFSMTLAAPLRTVTLTSVGDEGSADGKRNQLASYDGLVQNVTLELTGDQLIYDPVAATIVLEFAVSDVAQTEPPAADGATPQTPVAPIDDQRQPKAAWQITRPELTVTGTVQAI